MSATEMTARSTITMHDGRRYIVRQRDQLVRVGGPVELVRIAPPEGDGGWYERDGPLVAWFRWVPGAGWLHKETGRCDRDSVGLALRVIDGKP